MQLAQNVYKFLPQSSKIEIACHSNPIDEKNTVGYEHSQLLLASSPVRSLTSIRERKSPSQPEVELKLQLARKQSRTTEDLQLCLPLGLLEPTDPALGAVPHSPNITLRRTRTLTNRGTKLSCSGSSIKISKTPEELSPHSGSSSFHHVNCSVLDSVAAHAPELLLSGTGNSAPIIITFKITALADMAQFVCKTLHTIVNLCHEPTSPVILIAEHENVGVQ